MAGLCEGGNEPPGSLKAVVHKNVIRDCVKHHHLRPALRRKRRHLVVQNPIILHDNARSHTSAAVKDLCATGNGRFWIEVRAVRWPNLTTLMTLRKKVGQRSFTKRLMQEFDNNIGCVYGRAPPA
ncbi:hypothetical protein ANN_19929 [Periplaneta americana]|uniref:Uncharacterized protein n=1 Tax=Periplaneta americana TaxID=6978 RepID=A0ABQ8SCB0_PERAM|nr:hypothetical protein ANN_19929 [Periplaneta americana]